MILTSAFFAILASILSVITYLCYAHQIHKDLSNPNPVTIFIWLAEGIINVFTYFDLVKDWWQTLITITNALLIFVIFSYSLLRKKFPRLRVAEILILFASILVGIFWLTTDNQRKSHEFLQVVYFLSFLPVAIGIIKKTSKENPVAWNFAMISCLFDTLAVVSNYTGEILSLVYPVINGVLGNMVIVIIILLYKKKDSLIQ